ncbi:20509_t:CDS:2, partial [Cetraspora pellucida]
QLNNPRQFKKWIKCLRAKKHPHPQAGEASFLARQIVAGVLPIFGELKKSSPRQPANHPNLYLTRLLSVEHISLENLPDEEMPFAKETAEDSEENFKKNSEKFAKKEHDLNNLMSNLNNLIGKLEDLGQSMNMFDPKEGS